MRGCSDDSTCSLILGSLSWKVLAVDSHTSLPPQQCLQPKAADWSGCASEALWWNQERQGGDAGQKGYTKHYNTEGRRENDDFNTVLTYWGEEEESACTLTWNLLRMKIFPIHCEETSLDDMLEHNLGYFQNVVIFVIMRLQLSKTNARMWSVQTQQVFSNIVGSWRSKTSLQKLPQTFSGCEGAKISSFFDICHMLV